MRIAAKILSKYSILENLPINEMVFGQHTCLFWSRQTEHVLQIAKLLVQIAFGVRGQHVALFARQAEWPVVDIGDVDERASGLMAAVRFIAVHPVVVVIANLPPDE